MGWSWLEEDGQGEHVSAAEAGQKKRRKGNFFFVAKREGGKEKEWCRFVSPRRETKNATANRLVAVSMPEALTLRDGKVAGMKKGMDRGSGRLCQRNDVGEKGACSRGD